MKAFPPGFKEKFFALREQGLSRRDIGRALGVSESRIEYAVAKFCPRLTTHRTLTEGQRKRVFMLERLGLSRKEIAAEVKIPRGTVDKLLHKEDLESDFIADDQELVDDCLDAGGLPVLREVELSGNRRAVCVPTLRGPELVISYPVML